VTARKTQSWEDFKREVFGNETEVIAGVTVRVPTDLPLGYEDRVADLSDLDGSSKLEEFADLVTPLFGEGIFEQWIDAGMGQIEFLTAITWGMAQASRKPMTFSEAYELVNSDAAGKAPNRAARRAASKSPSRSTGGPSKRTSSASTASARKRSSS
jgi:hypothetical protein